MVLDTPTHSSRKARSTLISTVRGRSDTAEEERLNRKGKKKRQISRNTGTYLYPETSAGKKIPWKWDAVLKSGDGQE